MDIQLGKSWSRKLDGRIREFAFQVGVIEDGEHLDPIEAKRGQEPQLSEYAGGPIRKTSKNAGPLTNGQVLLENMKRLNINLLQRPFQERNSDIIKFTQGFLKYVLRQPGAHIRRVENLLQAVVRNPILRGEYGSNSELTSEVKGFNRPLIDTGQMFKSIIARAYRV